MSQPNSINDSVCILYCTTNPKGPGRIYKFRAFAVNEIGRSEWSEWSEELETHPFAPEAPTDPPSLTDPDAYTFTAGWDDIPGNGSPVTEWVVQWSVDPLFSSKNSIKEARTKERTHRCNRCLPGLVVHVRIAGINSEGQSRFGPSSSIKTLFDKPVQCVGGTQTRVWSEFFEKKVCPFASMTAFAGHWVVDSRPAIGDIWHDMAVPAALRSVLAEVTAAPEEEAQVLDVEKEILDLCQAALPELVFGSLHRVGAFQLGVQEPKAELDLVFVLPEGSPSQPSQLLERLRQALPKATPSLPQGALNAPGLRWLHGSHGGTRSVQLFLAKDDKQPAGADTPSTAALYAKEVSSALMENVPSLESFRNLLKLVKHWAKRRGLYGNLFGFFNGMTWAVCCGRVCQDHPDAALDDLFHFFFQDLCRWDWSSPITLQGTQGTSNAPGSAPPNTLVLLPGNSHGRPPVPASGKVSEAVMRLVLRELRRAELKKLPELW
eukprot:symbB.v1.2.035109.t1/scaffold4658.1/size36806/2